MADDDKDALTDTPQAPTLEAMVALQKELEDAKAQYKGLQRELDKARRRGESTEGLQAEMRALRDDVSGLYTAITTGEDVSDEAKAQAKQVRERSEREGAMRRLQEHYGSEIDDTLKSAGIEMDWDTDPRLEKAREAWARNEPLEAARIARRAVIEALRPDPKALENEVARKVEEALKQSGIRKVDTKESTAGGKQEYTPEEFARLPQEKRLEVVRSMGGKKR